VMTSMTNAIAQMPIEQLHPDRVKRLLEDLPGAPEGLPGTTSVRSESP
jgi:hypothetical protein